MSEQNKKTLKRFFEQGDRPTQGQYANLIDSALNLTDSDKQGITSDIVVTGSGEFLGPFTGSKAVFADLTFPGSMTASGDISSSGNLFIETSEEAENDNLKTLVINPTTGKVFHTGSYGSGGGGGGGGGISFDGSTTNGVLTFLPKKFIKVPAESFWSTSRNIFLLLITPSSISLALNFPFGV